MNKYPLYPELSEKSQKEAQQLIESFKAMLDIIIDLNQDILEENASLKKQIAELTKFLF